MAKFSQGFLSSLGRPAMTQSLFDLGAAIGGVPGQLQQRKQRREEAGMLAGLTPGSIEYNEAVARILQSRGQLEKAATLGATIEQQKRDRNVQRTSSQMLMSELQDYQNNEMLPESLRKQAGNFLRAAAVLGDNAKLLEPRVAELRTKIPKMEDPSLSQYRKAVSSRYGIPSEELQGLSEAQINKMAEGTFSTPKPYLTKDGKTVMLSTLDKTGKVRDPESGQYAYPAELNLSPAAQVSRVIQSVDNAVDQGVFSEAFAKTWAGTYSEALAKADEAAVSYRKNLETEAIVDDMFTGVLANVQLEIARVADKLNIGGKTTEEKVANSEEFFARRGEAVLKNIKLLGAGSAISNADVTFMRAVVGQDRTLNAETIKRILRIEREALTQIVEAANTKTQQAVSLNLMDEEQAEVFMKPPLVSPETDGSLNMTLEDLRREAGISG